MEVQMFVTKGEKMEKNSPALPKKRRELKKNQAIVVMVIGAILLAQAIFISAEVGSSTHWIKNVVGLIGLVVLIVGLCLRPVKANPEGK
jgi:uncharacterized protein (DUF983 family)